MSILIVNSGGPLQGRVTLARCLAERWLMKSYRNCQSLFCSGRPSGCAVALGVFGLQTVRWDGGWPVGWGLAGHQCGLCQTSRLCCYDLLCRYALRGLHCGPSGLDLAFLKSAPKSEVEESQVKESQ